MIKLAPLTEIKVVDKNFPKREIIKWFLKESPYIFEQIMDVFNFKGNIDQSDMNEIFSYNYDIDDGNNEKIIQEIQQKTKLLLQNIKPGEIFIQIFKEHLNNGMTIELKNPFKFINIQEMDDHESMVLLSNEKFI